MSLSIGHANVRSLPKNFMDITTHMKESSLNIACFTETWLDSSYPSELFYVQGYHPMFRKDRSGKQGGGVAVYISEDLPAKRFTDIEFPECIAIEVTLSRRRKMLLITVYRPPSKKLSDIKDFCSSLQSILEAAMKRKRFELTVIVGDFNAKNCDWQAGGITDQAGTALSDLCLTLSMTQLVRENTRQGNSGLPESLLDLVITDRPDLVRNVGVLPPIGSSDHCLVLTKLLPKQLLPAKKTLHEHFDYGNARWDEMNQSLLNTDWHSELHGIDIDTMVRRFSEILSQAVEEYIPKVRYFVRPGNKPWYTPHLHRLKRIRDRLFSRFRKASDEAQVIAGDAYRAVRNIYVAELRRAERHYYSKMSYRLSSNTFHQNTRQWWKLAKSVSGSTSTSAIPPLEVDGCFVTNSTAKAECLNSFFTELSFLNEPAFDPTLSLDRARPQGHFQFSHITSTEVLQQLQKLNIAKSCGLDGIGNYILRATALGIASPLAVLFNSSLSMGKFPTTWKPAVVVPLYKQKGDRSAVSSYRPVSLTLSVSKVFERLVHKQLLTYLLNNNFISDHQYGFLPGRSTLLELASILQRLHTTLADSRDKFVRTIFLDISKAFNRVWHTGLLHKLDMMGIDRTWFKSYLSDRTQCTRVDGVKSSFSKLHAGVPQGTVLGPLLFLCYVNDLPTLVYPLSTYMFADDTALVSTQSRQKIFSTSAKTQAVLNRVVSWSQDWCVTFNASKSTDLVITGSRRGSVQPPTLTIQGIEIPTVKSTLHLGVRISTDLKWSAHVRYLRSKVAGAVGMLRYLRQRLPSFFIATIYICVIRPTLEYNSPIWDSLCQTEVKSLEDIQLSVAKLVLPLSADSHPSYLLHKLEWPTLAWRRRIARLHLFWKLLHGEGPPDLVNSTPIYQKHRTSRELRHPESVTLPRCCTELQQSSWMSRTAADWNCLSKQAQSTASFVQFKKILSSDLSSDKFKFGMSFM